MERDQNTDISNSAEFLRHMLIILALLQIYTYSGAVIFAMFIGGIDILLPVKVAYVEVIVILFILPARDINTALRNRSSNLGQLGLSMFRSAVEIVGGIGFLYIEALFLLTPLSYINLTKIAFSAKVIVSIGVAFLLVFTYYSITDLLSYKRRGVLPKVSQSAVTPINLNDKEGDGK